MRCLLVLYSNNFFSLANYIMIVLFCYDVVWKRKFKRILAVETSIFYILMLSSLFLFAFTKHNGFEITLSAYLSRYISPVVLFYIGYVQGGEGFKSLKMDIIVMSFSMFIHGFVNVIKNVNVDILSIAGRQYQDIYGGAISATIQNLMFIMSCALFFYFIICEENKVLKLIGIFAAIAGIYGTIANASRTLLYVTLLIFILSLFLYLILNTNLETGIVKGALILCVLAFVSLLVLWLDIFGIQEWFDSTALGRRGADDSVSDNLRWGYAGEILALLPQYPFGNVPTKHYAHNFWVDIAKEAGVIPFMLYIIIVLKSLLKVKEFYLSNIYSNNDKIFLISIITAHCMVFFTEPVMQGSPMTFSIFCFIVGGLCSVLNTSNSL